MRAVASEGANVVLDYVARPEETRGTWAAIEQLDAFFGTQFAAEQFIAQGEGGIVINISSVHEDWPMPGKIPPVASPGPRTSRTSSSWLPAPTTT